ncbi:MAG: hypothetical protein ABR512_13860, partial [Desulfopila sp.]
FMLQTKFPKRNAFFSGAEPDGLDKLHCALFGMGMFQGKFFNDALPRAGLQSAIGCHVQGQIITNNIEFYCMPGQASIKIKRECVDMLILPANVFEGNRQIDCTINCRLALCLKMQ